VLAGGLFRIVHPLYWWVGVVSAGKRMDIGLCRASRNPGVGHFAQDRFGARISPRSGIGGGESPPVLRENT